MKAVNIKQGGNMKIYGYEISAVNCFDQYFIGSWEGGQFAKGFDTEQEVYDYFKNCLDNNIKP
jgi:hypothetical protein